MPEKKKKSIDLSIVYMPKRYVPALKLYLSKTAVFELPHLKSRDITYPRLSISV